jgi:hypothetical protein
MADNSASLGGLLLYCYMPIITQYDLSWNRTHATFTDKFCGTFVCFARLFMITANVQFKNGNSLTFYLIWTLTWKVTVFKMVPLCNRMIQIKTCMFYRVGVLYGIGTLGQGQYWQVFVDMSVELFTGNRDVIINVSMVHQSLQGFFKR